MQGKQLGKKTDQLPDTKSNELLLSAISKLFQNIQQLAQERNDTKFTFSKYHCQLIVEEVKKDGHNAEFFRVKMQSFINTYLDLVESNRARQLNLIQLLSKINQETIEKTTLTLKYPQISQAYLQAHNLLHKYKRQSLQYSGFIDVLVEENKKYKNQKRGFFSGFFESKSDIKLPRSAILSQPFVDSYEQNKSYLNTIENLKRDISFITQKNEVLQQNIERYKDKITKNQKKNKIELHNFQQRANLLHDQMQKKIDELKRNAFNLTKQKEFIETKITKIKTKYQQQVQKLQTQIDLKNPTNIHEYIDGHQHLLVLIKMKNGHLLGAFSQDKLQQAKQYTQSFGFLFSLTNKKVFTINRQNKESKVLTYDQNWVIFGNSELRMQSNSDVIFSNLGIANRYMGEKGDNYMQLLGTNVGEKQEVAKSYEFYKMSFVHQK